MVAVMVGSAPTVGVSLGAGGVVRGADDVTMGVFTGVGGATGVPVAVGAAGCGGWVVGATAAAGGEAMLGAHAASASSAAAHAMRRQRTIVEMHPFRLKCSSAKCTPADTRDWNAIRPVCLLKIGMLLL
jgi:dihydrodipicolinate synthase/N-acetylneuraminate lyase